MKIVRYADGGSVGPNYAAHNLDDAWLDEEPGEAALSPEEFRAGMQLIYAALLTGTVLVSKDAGELQAFLTRNGADTVTAIGEEITAARLWCEQVAASLRLLEARTLTAAMSLGGHA